MENIKFRFKDEKSQGKWVYQECYLESVEECKKIYGLDGSDNTLQNYEILMVDGILTDAGIKDYFEKLKKNPRISRVKYSNKLSGDKQDALWYGKDVLSFVVDKRFKVTKRATGTNDISYDDDNVRADSITEPNAVAKFLEKYGIFTDKQLNTAYENDHIEYNDLGFYENYIFDIKENKFINDPSLEEARLNPFEIHSELDYIFEDIANYKKELAEENIERINKYREIEFVYKNEDKTLDLALVYPTEEPQDMDLGAKIIWQPSKMTWKPTSKEGSFNKFITEVSDAYEEYIPSNVDALKLFAEEHGITLEFDNLNFKRDISGLTNSINIGMNKGEIYIFLPSYENEHFNIISDIRYEYTDSKKVAIRIFISNENGNEAFLDEIDVSDYEEQVRFSDNGCNYLYDDVLEYAHQKGYRLQGEEYH